MVKFPGSDLAKMPIFSHHVKGEESLPTYRWERISGEGYSIAFWGEAREGCTSGKKA